MILRKENLLPVTILVVSSFIFLSYTAIQNPYSKEIQIFIMFCLILLNLGIFHFHNLGDKKISFLFFFLNCFVLFIYIRVALPEKPVLSLYYHFIIFLGFHAFEGTFSKRFYLRTKIIIMGYCKDFAFIKLFLWVCLVLLPSLMKYGPVIFTVYYPVLLFCYLFEYDIILFFLIFIFLWCCLIILMNKYQFGLNYLKFILNYFSRRACLHYVGNAFGSRIVKIFELLTPAKAVGTAVMFTASVGGGVALEHIKAVQFSASQAAKESIQSFLLECEASDYKPDPHLVKAKELAAFEKHVLKEKRLGSLILSSGIVGIEIPKELNLEKLRIMSIEQKVQNAHLINPPVRTLEAFKLLQIENRTQILDDLRTKVHTMSDEDSFKVFKRALKDIALKDGSISLNEKQFFILKEDYTREEFIKFIMNEYREVDNKKLAEIKNLDLDKYFSSNLSTSDTYTFDQNPLGERHLLDIKQLDSSDAENYIEDKPAINSLATEHTLPTKLKPAADRPEFFTPADQANESPSYKRTIYESSSSDVSETSASLEKPFKKSHSES